MFDGEERFDVAAAEPEPFGCDKMSSKKWPLAWHPDLWFHPNVPKKTYVI